MGRVDAEEEEFCHVAFIENVMRKDLAKKNSPRHVITTIVVIEHVVCDMHFLRKKQSMSKWQVFFLYVRLIRTLAI